MIIIPLKAGYHKLASETLLYIGVFDRGLMMA